MSSWHGLNCKCWWSTYLFHSRAVGHSTGAIQQRGSSIRGPFSGSHQIKWAIHSGAIQQRKPFNTAGQYALNAPGRSVGIPFVCSVRMTAKRSCTHASLLHSLLSILLRICDIRIIHMQVAVPHLIDSSCLESGGGQNDRPCNVRAA